MKVMRKSLLILGMVMFTAGLFAQTLVDAGEKYNAANEKYKAKDYAGAVQLYEEALSMCKEIGGSAIDLQTNVEKQLTNAYFRNGLTLYKKKKFDKSIEQLQKAKNLASETGNSSMEKKAVIYIARVYSTKGNVLVKQKKIDEAFAQYDKALEVKPNCINAYLGKALANKEKGDMTQMMANVDKVLELGASNPKAAKKVAKAKKIAFVTLKSNGASELQKEHPSKALQYLTDAQKYGKTDADIYYYIALANLKLKKWDDAINSAGKALELNSDDKSDIYFAIAEAYAGKGDTANACKNYKMVKKGPNVEAAKYQITQVLKCK
jgi:tetratricopeptide (TPR) repeat protein